MRSMTGFGAGEAELAGSKLVCEIRALNHRFLDLRVRMPETLAAHAFFVEQLARQQLARGRFDVGMRLDDSAGELRFSHARARSVYQSLLKLRDELAPGSEVPVAALAALPQLFTDTMHTSVQETEQAVRKALLVALGHLSEMREREGQALARDFHERVGQLRELSEQAQALSEGAATQQLGRLRERVARLLSEGAPRPDAGRLETELALLADRSDVTEELVRLTSHFAQFEALLADSGPVGRKLEFLLQEMSRETNTLGSKSQDVKLSHLVVEIKAELEKIREQVQNVE